VCPRANLEALAKRKVPFLLKKEEVTGEWRKLHEELHNMYALPHVINDEIKDEMDGTCSIHVRDEKCIHNFDWKTYTWLGG